MNKYQKKSLKKRLRNKLVKSKIKLLIKGFILNNNENAFRNLQSKIMKAVKKKVFKAKKVIRKLIILKKKLL